MKRLLKTVLRPLWHRIVFMRRTALGAFLLMRYALWRRFSPAPVTLDRWLRLRRLVRRVRNGPDPLMPDLDLVKSSGTQLGVDELNILLANDEFGVWSMDADAIKLLWKLLWQERPLTILECGAGVSTLLLAKYAELGAGICIVSLEQKDEEKTRIEQRLATAGIGDSSTILYVPTTPDGRYQVDASALTEALRGRKADWLLIDGPSGPSGCRIHTLTDLCPFLISGARIFLDDATRDGELDALISWAQIPEVEVAGIYPTRKGLGKVIWSRL